MSLARLLTLRRRRRRSEPSSELMPLDPKEEDGANGNGSQDVGGYTVLFQDEPITTHVSTTEAPEIKRRLQLLTRWLRRASGTLGSLRQQRPASLTADTAMEGTDGQFVFVPIERTKTRRRPLTELLMPRRFRMPKFSFKRWRRGNKANDESIGLLSPEGSRQNYQSNKDNDDEYDESMDIRFVIDQVLPTEYSGVWEHKPRHRRDKDIRVHTMSRSEEWIDEPETAIKKEDEREQELPQEEANVVLDGSENTVTKRRIKRKKKVRKPKLVWMDIANPREEDALIVAQKLGLTEEDALTIIDTFEEGFERIEYRREFTMIGLRLTLDRSSAAQTAYRHQSGADELMSGFVLFILHPKMAVTLHTGPVTPIQKAFLACTRSNKAVGPTRALHFLYISAYYDWQAVVRAISEDAEILEEIVLSLGVGDYNDAILRMNTTRSLVSQLTRDLGRKNVILHTISAGMSKPVRTQAYVRETLNHMDDLVEALKNCLQSLSELQQRFIGKVAVESNEAADALGYSSKILAIIATISVPIQSLGGIAGMNVYFPSHIDSKIEGPLYYRSFWILLCVQLFLCGCVAGYLRLLRVI